MISYVTPAHLHGAPHALVQPAVLLSLCRLYLCLRKEAYPKVLVGWARTILLLHVEGININARLSPCVPAGLLASYVCVSTAMVLAISAAQHRLTLQVHSITIHSSFQILRQGIFKGALPVLQVGSRSGRLGCIEQVDLVRCRMRLNRRPFQRRPERGDTSAFQGCASHARQMPCTP